MKKCLLLGLILLSLNCFSQNRNSVWCFGDSAGIDFSNLNNHVPFTSGMDGRGTSCSISDSNGNLFFYACTPKRDLFLSGYLYLGVIYNKNHQVMVNGDSLVGRAWYNEMITIPKPGNNNQYYLFCLGETSYYGLYYSLIDLTLDNGSGEVIQKNITINNLMAVDALAAVKHGNGRDWWLVFKDYNTTNNNFRLYLITPSGISFHHSQSLGGVNSTNSGNFTFSNSGSKALFTTITGLIQFMDFDRCTGYFNNANIIEQEVLANPLKRYFGAAFSADESKIYVSTNNNVSYLFQYDLNSNNIPQSKDTIYGFSNVIAEGGLLRLAPDNKIYMSNAWYDGVNYNYPYPDSAYNFINMNLSVINEPDSLGMACDFQPYSFYLGGKRTYWGLPNNPNYDLGTVIGSACDTLTSINPSLSIKEATMYVYYHPSLQTLFVNAQNIKGKNCLLQFFDMNGRCVFTFHDKASNGHFTHDVQLQTIANGIYILKLTTEKETLTTKFVKQ